MAENNPQSTPRSKKLGFMTFLLVGLKICRGVTLRKGFLRFDGLCDSSEREKSCFSHGHLPLTFQGTAAALAWLMRKAASSGSRRRRATRLLAAAVTLAT